MEPGRIPSVKERRRNFERVSALDQASILPESGPVKPPRTFETISTPSPPSRPIRRSALIVVRPKLPPPTPPKPVTPPRLESCRPVSEEGTYEHIYAVYDKARTNQQDSGIGDSVQSQKGSQESQHSLREDVRLRGRPLYFQLSHDYEALESPEETQVSVFRNSLIRKSRSEEAIANLFTAVEPCQTAEGNSQFYASDEVHYAASSIQERLSFYEGLKPRSSSDIQQTPVTKVNMRLRSQSDRLRPTEPRPSRAEWEDCRKGERWRGLGAIRARLGHKGPMPLPPSGSKTPVCIPRVEEGSSSESEDEKKSEGSPDVSKRAERARRIQRQTTIMYDHQALAFRRRKGGARLFQMAACVRLVPLDQLPEEERTNLRVQGLLGDGEKIVDAVPRIVWSIPNQLACNPDTWTMLPYLVYPDFTHVPSPSTSPESFVVTLTDAEAQRNFLYCVRHQEDGLPEVLCLLSPLAAAGVYQPVLNYATACPPALRKEFLTGCFRHELPDPGQALRINAPGMRLGQKLVVEYGSRWGGVEGSASLLASLGPTNLIAVFTALLCEKRVLIAGDSVSRVARSVQAIAELLRPLDWPHTLFPIVPDTHVRLCHCPTPYLIGILRANLDQLRPINRFPDLLTGSGKDEEEFLLILELDYGVLRDSDYSQTREDRLRARSLLDRPLQENRCLPRRVAARLASQVKEALGATSQPRVRQLLDFNANKTDQAFKGADEALRAAFSSALGSLLGHYRGHFVRQQDGALLFQKAAFIAAPKSRSHRAFLKWFSETCMFQIWLRERLASAQEDSETNQFPPLDKASWPVERIGDLVKNVSSLLSW